VEELIGSLLWWEEHVDNQDYVYNYDEEIENEEESTEEDTEEDVEDGEIVDEK
jgi:hypothetical protein